MLTAELPDVGTAAKVIGSLTFTSAQYDVTIPHRQFFFITLPNNTAGSILIPVTTTPAPLTSLLTGVSANDTVFVRVAIGWTAQSRLSNVLFKIWRGVPFADKLVASVLDSGESVTDMNKVTSFSGVDTGFTSAQDVVYFLTAETTDPGTLAQVVGALTMTSFRATTSPPSSFYTLPDNTAGSVSIPIRHAPTHRLA